MSTRVVYTKSSTVDEAVTEITSSFKSCRPRLILCFSSVKYDIPTLARKLKRSFGEVPIIGCSTAGEIAGGKLLKGSIAAMAFDEETIEDVCVEMVPDIKEQNNVERAFQKFAAYYDQPMMDLDFGKYVGLLLPDGLSGAEEKLMDTIGNLTNVTFIGGSAGDDLAFSKTYVFVDENVQSNAAALALIKTKRGFDVIKTQSFKSLGKTLKATKVEKATRTVLEFNKQPAALAYAEAIGETKEQAKNHFMKHPVGLMDGDEPYVRSPQQFKDNAIVFYCQILEGMELKLLESTDIVEDTRRAVRAKQEELGEIKALINFHCILRTLDLEARKATDAYGSIFAEIPAIGFSTYGEEYVGHINQTSTMLILK